MTRALLLGAMVMLAAPVQAQSKSQCLSMTYIEPGAGVIACSALLADPALEPETRTMALIQRAYHSYETGDYAAVEADLDAMEGRIGDDAAMYLVRGKLRIEIGQPAAALGDFNRANELDPDNPEVLVGRGKALEALGRPQDAAEDYNRADEIDPMLTEALRAR